MKPIENKISYQIPEKLESMVDHYVMIDLYQAQRNSSTLDYVANPSDKNTRDFLKSQEIHMQAVVDAISFAYKDETMPISDRVNVIYDLLKTTEERQLNFYARTANVSIESTFSYGYYDPSSEPKDDERAEQIKHAIEQCIYNDESGINEIVGIFSKFAQQDIEKFLATPYVTLQLEQAASRKLKLQKIAEFGGLIAASAFGAFIGASLTRRR